MYFFEQFGSGHSSKTGDGGGLVQFNVCNVDEDVDDDDDDVVDVEDVVDDDDEDDDVTFDVAPAITFVFLLPPPLPLPLLCKLFASSSPARLFRLLLGSGRGGTNGVGDDGAVDVPPEPPFDDAAAAAAAPRLPLTPPPPFLNLL